MTTETKPETRIQTQTRVTAIVLAGGMGRRMQGVDKGLVEVCGREMVSWVIDVLRPNVHEVIVNANRSRQQYEAFGARVIEDSIEGYQGPLAGIEAGMAAATTDWVFTCPCDSPLQSEQLLQTMWQSVQECDAQLGMAHDGERSHPVFSLLSVALLPSLRAYLQAGERKIDRWFAQHNMVIVDCSEHASSFINVNTSDEKEQLEERLRADKILPGQQDLHK